MKKYLKTILKNLLSLPKYIIEDHSTSINKNSLLKTFYCILMNKGYSPKCIYDIGANKGTWTQETIKYFPNSKYYLFEPQISLTKEIQSKFTKLSSVQLFNVGVGNKDGELNFTIHDRDDSCSFNISKEEALENGFKQIKTPIVRLDSFIEENNLELPDLLKIDAEGFDIEVLEGAQNTIQKNVQIILVEVAIMNKKFRNDINNVINYMDKLGFIVFDITDLNRPFNNNVLWLCEFVFIKKGGLLDIDYSEL
jgi:FkbM family methyltransferase